jgi:uncharacterized membrane protein
MPSSDDKKMSPTLVRVPAVIGVGVLLLFIGGFSALRSS